MHTDACLGFCWIGYQSSEVAGHHCDAFRNILIRMKVAIAKGHDASKQNSAQKAKVGHCPCCTKATHIALPPTYPLGERSAKKGRGMSLRPEECRFGRMAEHRLAAQ